MAREEVEHHLGAAELLADGPEHLGRTRTSPHVRAGPSVPATLDLVEHDLARSAAIVGVHPHARAVVGSVRKVLHLLAATPVDPGPEPDRVGPGDDASA